MSHSKTGASTNRLAVEKSPYLLQHAANPVNWYPWGKEAFEKARQDDKLVFLSIGYSTCHWCHVMERESFENREIADLLNEHFVSVKVDREERPDIDQIYMAAVQALTGSGGWPLTVFLTPEGKPVTGGTYFPPMDFGGRPGMKTVLPRLAQLWKEQRKEMEEAGSQISEWLQKASDAAPGPLSTEEVFSKAFKTFEATFDPDHGGFGGAPKFPRSHELSFLLRYGFSKKEPAALAMVETTLVAMAWGGIYDQLGGGFHRYSTDERWLVPHFEKMLYDQSILARTYLEAYQVTRKSLYAETARDIFNYVSRDMTSPEGAFYSAEDADSEGEEGKFYVWRPEEISKILGKEFGALFNEFYRVTDEGNFEHGTSILHVRETLEAFAQRKGLEAKAFRKQLAEARQSLFQERKKRVPPYKDDKILTSWNGLMISALAYGASVLDAPEYAQKAARAADFILKSMQKDGKLFRRHREGQTAVSAFQEDYAAFALGLLDLYEATFEIRWLEESLRLARDMVRLFWDSANGGFFYTASGSEALIARSKEYYDGAVPSGNSMAAHVLLRLGRMTGDGAFEKRAGELFASNAGAVANHPTAYTELLAALDLAAGPSREVVIAGDPKAPEFEALRKLLWQAFDPSRVLLHHPSGSDAQRIEALADHLKNQPALNGKTTVYVCENRACKTPATTPEELKKQLSR